VGGAAEAARGEGSAGEEGSRPERQLHRGGPGAVDKPRGDDAFTRRSREGDWAKREKGSVFGFKLHVKTDLDLGLIRAVEATPASVHDSCVDLSEPGEAVYRDKGHFGAEPRGWDATMMRGVRGHPLGECNRLRNLRVGSKRRPVERIFAVVKRVFRGGRILVTSLSPCQG